MAKINGKSMNTSRNKCFAQSSGGVKMISNYKIITLCGSTKFKDEFIKAQKELTLKGHIVISVGLFGHADGDYNTVLTNEVKIMLDDMHKRKIDMADEIFVINKEGYIGSSTRSEIEYAKINNKGITYLEQKL
jgi:hypothetical protein